MLEVSSTVCKYHVMQRLQKLLVASLACLFFLLATYFIYKYDTKK